MNVERLWCKAHFLFPPLVRCDFLMLFDIHMVKCTCRSILYMKVILNSNLSYLRYEKMLTPTILHQFQRNCLSNRCKMWIKLHLVINTINNIAISYFAIHNKDQMRKSGFLKKKYFACAGCRVFFFVAFHLNWCGPIILAFFSSSMYATKYGQWVVLLF